jgi:hypothetical protein
MRGGVEGEMSNCEICGKPSSPYPNWILSNGHGYHVGCLAEDYQRARNQLTTAKKFVRGILDMDWGYCAGDGQEYAQSLGIVTETKYDPAIHSESDIAEPGDPWCVIAEEWKLTKDEEGQYQGKTAPASAN